MFIGKSLTNIRVLNDLSRNQLAERLGVTEQAIWQYENGYMSPKLEVVNKLKTIFNVKSSYFYNSDLVSKADLTNINVENIAYRSEAINSLNKTQSELMHIRFIDVFLKKVEEKIAYPKNYLVGLRNGIISFIKENSEMDRDIQIKNIAKIARIRIGLDEDSNKNLLFLLEKAGAFVLEKEISNTINATLVIPYDYLRKSWQKVLLDLTKQWFPNNQAVLKLINELYQRYPKGFYVNAEQKMRDAKGAAKYISPKHFRMVGRFGLYSRRSYQRAQNVLDLYSFIRTKQLSMVLESKKKRKSYRQRMIEAFDNDPFKCPYCHRQMDLVEIWHADYGFLYHYMEDMECITTGRKYVNVQKQRAG